METQATAPGKVILFGEHAVVYGRPAIAIPVTQVCATAVVADKPTSGIWLSAPDLNQEYDLQEAPAGDALALAVQLVAQLAPAGMVDNITLTVSSTIPIASGLGSGAAIATAVIKALLQHFQLTEWDTPAHISALTYQVEKIHHGNPSGVDNTVVAFGLPVYFVRGDTPLIESFIVKSGLRLLVADSGVRSYTKEVVADVRQGWLDAPGRYEALFEQCGRAARLGREAMETGDLRALGAVMGLNHLALQEMGVSTPLLDRLVTTAVQHGALGAKLSGAGRGGNMIALVTETGEAAVRDALLTAGATRVVATHVAPTTP